MALAAGRLTVEDVEELARERDEQGDQAGAAWMRTVAALLVHEQDALRALAALLAEPSADDGAAALPRSTERERPPPGRLVARRPAAPHAPPLAAVAPFEYRAPTAVA